MVVAVDGGMWELTKVLFLLQISINCELFILSSTEKQPCQSLQKRLFFSQLHKLVVYVVFIGFLFCL